MSEFYATPISLMRPERLVLPGNWVGHIPFSFWLIEVLRPRCVVELGTHSGNSFCSFLQAAHHLGLEGVFCAVDHWQGDRHAGSYDEDVFAELGRYVGNRYGGLGQLMRMDFDAAVDHFADGSVDLLHIDGLHTFEAVQHDFATWLPKLSARGVVIMHDSNVRRDDFGVHRLVADLAQAYPVFEFLHAHGLGVIQVGRDLVSPGLAMLMAGRADAAGIEPRELFARLGTAWVEHLHLERLQELVVQQARLRDERSEIGSRSADIGRAMTNEIAALDNETRDVQGMVDSSRLLASGLFNPKAYRQQLGAAAVALSDAELAVHYLDCGEAVGYRPSDDFHPDFYRNSYPDLAGFGGNMLLHYIIHGRSEGRLFLRR